MKTGGYLLITSPEGKTEADTLRCVHCSRMWVVKKGSGIERGFCMNCMGTTCGSKACFECVPLMKKIEAQERKAKLMEIVGAS